MDKVDEAMQQLSLTGITLVQIVTLILWAFQVLTFWQATIPAALVGLYVEFLVLKYFVAAIIAWREGEKEKS